MNAAMNLVIDIGNSFLKAAFAEKSGALSQRLQINSGVQSFSPTDEATLMAWRENFSHNFSSLQNFSPQSATWNVASVVPRKTDELRAWVNEKFLRDTFREILPSSIPLKSEAVSCGVDRLLAGFAAADLLTTSQEKNAGSWQAILVVSVGTATTIDLVRRNKTESENDSKNARWIFSGGAIGVGATMGFSALHEKTASLPRVADEDISADFVEFGSVFSYPAHDTISAIRAGILAQQIGGIKFIYDFTLAQNDITINEALQKFPLIITGGGASIVAKILTPFLPARVEPDLVLRALAILSYQV